jgi:hypothetical protein
MEINYNSISARLYREFYNTKNMPQSLCPYFWKLVFAWPITILLSPLLIPFWIINKLDKSDTAGIPVIGKAFIGAILYACLFLVFCIGVTISSMWVTYYTGTIWWQWYIGGFIVMFGLLVFGVILLARMLKDRRYQKRLEERWDENGNYIPREENKPNLLIEFVKAKYNRYCPKITWKN